MLGASLLVFPFWVFLLTGALPFEAAAPDNAPAKTAAPGSADGSEVSRPGAKPKAGETTQPAQQGTPKGASSNAETVTQAPAAAKSPSVLQLLEGHETELVIAAAIAAGSFIIGWICGGNYYLRRDRLQRRKIRL